MTDEQLGNLSAEIGRLLQRQHASVVTAESCTGGGIARMLTATPGSSAWFGYGFVTYSNEAKKKLIGVQQATLDTYGAVSDAVVLEMARGALKISGANYAISVSGIAGPDGGTPQKPVGTVYFGFATSVGKSEAWRQHLVGDRQQIRHLATVWALQNLRKQILENKLDTV
ncbi:nicotinamide-nucleotide amidase [Izhakiella capsodis]|uniref:Nicotinamide-nucleotide amidase n=1 Tax=Izhakiella capsodis TaxID=1367852 RepID=A0A1I4WA96_9GAMM|nr:nicotinamide-nucleotide amidase [Izhakiella capsodis]SFN10684.1 nicotinamide-nucleotide amidase [Izhakiella capsodis]